MYPRHLPCAAVPQIKTGTCGSHVPANGTADHCDNMRMDSLIGELRKQTTELRQQGEDIHQQMCQMYNAFKDIAKNHGKRSSSINKRFVDISPCDSEDCYDTMDWKMLENRWKTSQEGCSGSVDSGYKSDYPSLSDVISCPSYPKKPKILMGTRLIGWQKSRDCNFIPHYQSCSNLEERKNSDVSASRSSSINDEHLEDKPPREDTCLLSPPLRIVRFSDNVKTSKCKRIVPKYKKNRLSLKGTPARRESFTPDYFEDSKNHSYGKIVYYDLDRVDFLNTSLEESHDIKKVVKDVKRASPKETSYPQACVNEHPNFKKPSAVKTIPNSCHKRASKVEGDRVNVIPAKQNNTEISRGNYDPHRTKYNISDSCHIYEEIIYDVSVKNEDPKKQSPPLPQRSKEMCKKIVSTPDDENRKYYRRKSNPLWSVSNKMGKLTISNSQSK